MHRRLEAMVASPDSSTISRLSISSNYALSEHQTIYNVRSEDVKGSFDNREALQRYQHDCCDTNSPPTGPIHEPSTRRNTLDRFGVPCDRKLELIRP